MSQPQELPAASTSIQPAPAAVLPELAQSSASPVDAQPLPPAEEPPTAPAPPPDADADPDADVDIEPIEQDSQQTQTQPLSQPAPSFSAEHPSSDALPLTQELPPPTQETEASASQTQGPAIPPSLPPSQATMPIDEGSDDDASTAAPAPPPTPPSLPQSSSTGTASADTTSTFSPASTAVEPSALVENAEPVSQSQSDTSTLAPAPVSQVDSAPMAALAIQPSAQQLAKVEQEVAPALAAPATPELASAPNGTHPIATPNGALPTPSPTVASAPSAPVAPQQAPPSTPAAPPATSNGRPGVVQMSSGQIKCAQNFIRALKVRSEARWFLDPVDPVALNIPSYSHVVKEPMDLGTIDFKLSLTSFNRNAQASGNPSPRPSEKVRQAIVRNLNPTKDYYTTVASFERDVNLVFDNCARFNGEEHAIAQQGRALQEAFKTQMLSMPTAEPEPERKAMNFAPPPKPRTPSTSVIPAARRTSQTDAAGRAKREIVPPPSKDLPFAAEPQSASIIPGSTAAKKRRRTTLTPREQAHQARINAEDLRFATKIMDELYRPVHQNTAWVFYDLPDTTLDFAPAYYEMIKQPMSMRKINMKLKAGEFTDLAEFDASWQLLFRNCFTFNPADTDVYRMGKKMKDIYEDKMRKRPIHPPLSPDPLDDVEMLDADDEEARLADIQAQIARLKAEAASLKTKEAKSLKAPKPSPVVAAGPSNKKAKTSASSAGAAFAAPVMPAMNGMVAKATMEPPVSKAPKKKAAPKPKDANGSAAGGSKKKAASGGASPTRRASTSGGGGPNGAAKKQRRDSQPAKMVDTFQEITYQQKEELAFKIQELPEARLDGALSIIAEDKPPSAGDEDEIELDIDAIEPRTLYKLYTYVVGPPNGIAGSSGGDAEANGGGGGRSGGGNGGGAASAGGGAGGGGGSKSGKKKGAKKSKPASGAGAADGRKRGTGGLKRKNLDEEEEAQRIASLRQQLNQFNGESSAAGGSALPADGTHDDLVHSDSSSGDDSGSDSESDYD
ncbi:unnamed protein product [Tilletia controversa]|uniref:Bromodomain-containing protein n=3 Tax=Tilletia TaxID=13289 RepID=A0A8X7SXU2_9BASI|nr:hypothetical protein CF336_g1770 [Tilletia laevis]KAE8204253.1 hypothetical protein CF328_g1190 [Tilletia controversa]KAE8264010.1 hypothetical protein A4X03_0g1259 [Tilletia caries]KAE8207448.1 hypothetical protein CF335_g1130 [Tilletia laevis]KAE8248615.1 hypothetical protein A4X06_0g3598 [Tilletia controversa]